MSWHWSQPASADALNAPYVEESETRLSRKRFLQAAQMSVAKNELEEPDGDCGTCAAILDRDKLAFNSTGKAPDCEQLPRR